VEETGRVGHFDLAPGFLRQHELVVNDIVEMEHIGRNSEKLVVLERLRIAERHRAADVVKDARQIREIKSDRFNRIMRGKRTFALRELRPTSRALAELAMARGAFVYIDPLAILHRPGAYRRALPVRS